MQLIQGGKRSVHEELLYYTFENTITKKTMRNKLRVFPVQEDHGWISLAYRAEDMKRTPQHIRSYPTLFKHINQDDYRYMRMNLSYTSESHKKRQIRFMVGFFLDFDAEQLQHLGITNSDELRRHVESFGLTVVAIIATSSGFHVWLPMEVLRGSWNGERTIRRYDRVLKAIAAKVGSDPHAASAEHFFRCPNAQNVAYFNPVVKPGFDFYEAMFPEVIPSYDKETENTYKYEGQFLLQPGIQALLAGQIQNGKTKSRNVGRNNAAYTISKAFFLDGYSKEHALNELKKWYIALPNKTDFNFSEVVTCLEHAYTDGLGISGFYIEALTGIKFCPINKAKARGSRQNHFTEIEKDLITYLKNYYFKTGEHLSGVSNAKLAQLLTEEFGFEVSLSSLEKTIRSMKERGLLTVEKIRSGRSFVSTYTLDASLLVKEDGGTEKAASEKPAAKEQIHTSNSYTYILATGFNLINQANYQPIPLANGSQKFEKSISLFELQKNSEVAAASENAHEQGEFSVGGVNGSDENPIGGVKITSGFEDTILGEEDEDGFETFEKICPGFFW